MGGVERAGCELDWTGMVGVVWVELDDWMLGGWMDRCMMSYYKKTIITTLRH